MGNSSQPQQLLWYLDHFPESDQQIFLISPYGAFYVAPCWEEEPRIKLSSLLDST